MNMLIHFITVFEQIYVNNNLEWIRFFMHFSVDFTQINNYIALAHVQLQ